MLTYAGIGARATPPSVLTIMGTIADWLARGGWHLHTGGADGADTAFARSTPSRQKTVWLPWRGFRGHENRFCRTLDPDRLEEFAQLASMVHPTWDRCTPAAKKLHARNVAIILGPCADTPVDAVVCWTRDGAIRGGTGLAIRLANEWDIPVLNLGHLAPHHVCIALRDIRRQRRDGPD